MKNDPATQTQSGNPQSTAQFADRVKWASERLQAAHKEAATVILDQDYMIEMILATMVAGGNMLAEGMPGLAKTLTVKTIARISGLDFKRIQFTPDLQPIDLTGSDVLNKKDNSWEFRKGPLFGQLVLADEINRAGQKTQSAMLEAMEEKQITVDGTTYTLPRPFHVMATQNPVDQDGTSPLPEAQSDRFMTKLVFEYPNRAADKQIMAMASGTDANIEDMFRLRDQFKLTAASASDLTLQKDSDRASPVVQIFDAQDLIIMQKMARSLPLSESATNTAVDIIRALRPGPQSSKFINDNVAFGPSPRALIAFALVAKARALMDGRIESGHLSLTKHDILEIAEPVLAHRMAIKHSSRNVTFKDVMTHVKQELKL